MSYESKKRKRGHAYGNPAVPKTNGVDTSKPTAIFQPRGGRSWTLSVAIPGSIIANAQSHDLKTILAGQIARALAVFCVDEVIIFDDGHTWSSRKRHAVAQQAPSQGQTDLNATITNNNNKDQTYSYTGDADPNHFLTHLLSYLETPPHLRRHLFSIHPNLRTAGTLPSLDMPHHLRADEWCVYREGVTVALEEEEEEEDRGGVIRGRNKNLSSRKKKTHNRVPSRSEEEKSTIVEAGLRKKVIVPVHIAPKTRVTVKFTGQEEEEEEEEEQEGTYIRAQAISPSAPRTEAGYYWGYTIRRCSSLSGVFTECPWEGGYDLSFGTSERGQPMNSVPKDVPFEHMVVVFGGLAGLERACENDDELRRLGVGEDGEGVEKLFDHWINLLPVRQGSRTVRTEEAVWIGLMALKGLVDVNKGGFE